MAWDKVQPESSGDGRQPPPLRDASIGQVERSNWHTYPILAAKYFSTRINEKLASYV